MNFLNKCLFDSLLSVQFIQKRNGFAKIKDSQSNKNLLMFFPWKASRPPLRCRFLHLLPPTSLGTGIPAVKNGGLWTIFGASNDVQRQWWMVGSKEREWVHSGRDCYCTISLQGVACLILHNFCKATVAGKCPSSTASLAPLFCHQCVLIVPINQRHSLIFESTIPLPWPSSKALIPNFHTTLFTR